MPSEQVLKARSIAAMSEIFKPALSDAAVQLYVASLGDVPADDVARACAKLVTTAKFRPTPAEIRDAAGAAGVAAADRAMLAFSALERAISAIGYYGSPDFDDPLINATVRMLGGWERVCEMPEEEFDKWYRKEFQRTYETLSRTGVDGEATAPLIGNFEKINRVLGYSRDDVQKLIGADSVKRVATGLPWAGEQPKRLGGQRPGESAGIPRIEFRRP